MGYLGRQKRSQGLNPGDLASILLGERNKLHAFVLVNISIPLNDELMNYCYKKTK